MNPFRLAFSLLLIPRLFFTLIFFPLILSLLLVYLQLVATQLAVNTLDKTPQDVERKIADQQNDNFVRRIIYGDGKPLPPILVCQWKMFYDDAGNPSYEIPLDKAACTPGRLDVALHIKNIDQEKIDKYSRVLSGNVERLHICETCAPDIIISEQNGKASTDIKSVWGLMVLGLVSFDKDVTKYYVSSLRQTEMVQRLIGDRFLHISGFLQPISMHKIQTRSIIIMNIACLLIIALWLALKAHRKVLDYFARSGALLPMVAATGKGNFYAAIWVLTFFRVGAFLAAAIPLTIETLNRILRHEGVETMFGSDGLSMFIWLVAIFTGLTFATLVASIAELKHRHQIFSFLYRYIPILLCLIGALLWAGSFAVDGGAVEIFRYVLTALPVLGIAPVLVAPILKPKIIILLTHAVLTSLLLIFALKRNAQWFAAHLEDL